MRQSCGSPEGVFLEQPPYGLDHKNRRKTACRLSHLRSQLLLLRFTCSSLPRGESHHSLYERLSCVSPHFYSWAKVATGNPKAGFTVVFIFLGCAMVYEPPADPSGHIHRAADDVAGS